MQHPKEVIVMTMQQIIQQFQDEVMEAHLRKLRAEDEGEYSDAKVHPFRKFRAPFSGKAEHTFPE